MIFLKISRIVIFFAKSEISFTKKALGGIIKPIHKEEFYYG